MESHKIVPNGVLSGVISSSSINFLDDLVKEYLLFRGFSSSLKFFENDLKSEKEKSIRPDKITELLLSYVHQYDLTNLLDLWNFLELKYFSQITVKLGYTHDDISRKYELFILRYYLVHAIQTNKIDKAVEFFDQYVNKLQSQKEWKEWFCLPFTKNAEDLPQFSIYFSKNWIDKFMISLQNFLTITFQSLQLPHLLKYHDQNAFWSNLGRQDTHTDYNLFEQEFLQSEINDEFEFKNQDVTTKSSNGLIRLFKNFKNNKSIKSKEMKNLNLIANEIISDDSNIDNSYEKLTTKVDFTLEEDSSELETEPYLTLNQENLDEHTSAIVLIKISQDLKFFASVDSDGVIKGLFFKLINLIFLYYLKVIFYFDK